MSKLLFTERPRIVAALFPHYVRWLWRFAIAAVLVYFILLWKPVVFFTQGWLVFWLCVIALLGALIMVKHRTIALYNTRYYFHENALVVEFKLFVRKRQTIPYAQMQKITHKQAAWQRLFDVADVHIVTQDKGKPVVLQAVRRPEEFERRLHKLIQR